MARVTITTPYSSSSSRRILSNYWLVIVTGAWRYSPILACKSFCKLMPRVYMKKFPLAKGTSDKKRLQNPAFCSELIMKPCIQLFPYSNVLITLTSDAMIIWRRMKNNSRSLTLNIINMEEQLLANPKDVYYGSVLHVNMKFRSVPCNITTVSPSYDKVIFKFCICQKKFG